MTLLPPAGITNTLIGSAKLKEWTEELINTIVNGPWPGVLQEVVEETIPRVLAVGFALWVRFQGELGKTVGTMVDIVEAVAGPELQKMVAVGLSDFFGREIKPEEIGMHGGFPGRSKLADELGSLILTEMFGEFEAGGELSPELGRANADRVIGTNISTALEGWMGGVLTTGFLAKFFPNWADLDDILAQNVGFGRANRRVLGPLLTTLVTTPFSWYLNERFKPRIYNETQAVRALYRDQITEDDYFSGMARLGWDREKASVLKVVNGRLLEKEDIAKAVELGAIKTDELLDLYKTLGYAPDLAEIMRTVTIQDRMRTINNALESVARDMFRDGEIDEPAYRSLLLDAERSPEETEALVGLGLIERGRDQTKPPKDRRISRGVMERAYREGLILRTELETYYVEERYPDRDRAIMLQLQDLLKEKALPAPPEEE